MDKNLINISKIETFFNDLLDDEVSKNTFFTDLPPTIKQEWNDIVVVDCANAISDLNGCGKGTVLIFLYAKPFSSGMKNVARMSILEQKLNERIAANDSKNYIINRANTYTDYDEERNLHCNIVVLNLMIV